MPLGRAKLKALGKNPTDYGYEAGRNQPGRHGNYWQVGTGDNVAKIAEQVYGNQRMMAEIIRLNGGVSMLRPGMVLRLPNFKENKNIYISNDWAANMGMATTDELKSFYSANPGPYGTGAKATGSAQFSPEAGYGWGSSSAQADVLARQKQAAQGLAANNVTGGRGTMVPDYAARTAYRAPGTMVAATPTGYDPNMRGRGYVAPVTGEVARGTTIKNYSPAQQPNMTGTYLPQNSQSPNSVPPHIPASLVQNTTRGQYIGNVASGLASNFRSGVENLVNGVNVNAVTAPLLAGATIGQYLATTVDPNTGQPSTASNAVSRLKFFNSISVIPDWKGYFNTPVNKNNGQPIGQTPAPGFDVGAAAGGALNAVGNGLGYVGGVYNNLATGSPNGQNTPTAAKTAAAQAAAATPQAKQAVVIQDMANSALTKAVTKARGGNAEFTITDYKLIIAANLPTMTPTLDAYLLSLATNVPNTGVDIPAPTKQKGKWDPFDFGNGYMPTQMDMPGGRRGGGGGGGGSGRNIGPSIGMFAWRGL